MACTQCHKFFQANEWVVTFPHATNPRTSIPWHEWCFPSKLEAEINHTFCPQCHRDHKKITCPSCYIDISHHGKNCHCLDEEFE